MTTVALALTLGSLLGPMPQPIDTTHASELYQAPAIDSVIDGVTWSTAGWTPYLAPGKKGDSWGNHRAVVEVAAADAGKIVTVMIPWRRHDRAPEKKAVVVVDAATGKQVNSLPLWIDDMKGEILFASRPDSRVYHVYYMPWHTSGGYYPVVTYPDSLFPSDSDWVARQRIINRAPTPIARTTRIESVTPFHSFFPMEVIADPARADSFITAHGGWALVAEHRDYPIRMQHHLPQHWLDSDRPKTFRSRALRDESFTFQVGVVAGSGDRDSLRVSFEGFPPGIARQLTCFNCGGIDQNGQPFTKVVNVPAGTVQPLWIGWLVPDNQPAGVVRGRVVVQPAGQPAKSVPIEITVRPGHAVDHGYDEPQLMTRLQWLNSTVGSDTAAIVPPFTPVTVSGHTLGVLGRSIELGSNGLPQQLESMFTPDVTSASGPASPLLTAPIDLKVRSGNSTAEFRDADFDVHQPSRGAATWVVDRHSDRFNMRVEGRLEYDGMLSYRITVTAPDGASVDDISLPLLLRRDATTWMLGLGQEGGLTTDSLDWHWDVKRNQEGAWFGAVNKGLQYVLRDDNYVRPLNTNFYQSQPLNLPPSWYNDGHGGITIRRDGDVLRVDNSSGPRTLARGDSLHFNVRFLLTPFKPIDTDQHFKTRFVHQYVPVDSVVAWGGTVVNIHHANEINPYINYPFYHLEEQKEYIDEAHAKGVKVKLYDTIRELSYRAYELFALRSLGHEIFNDGKGGGNSWLQEHLVDHYHAGWRAAGVDDAAILDKGTSRWTNYYVEGIAWLARHQKIDGLYLDDIAFSRATVKRLVTVLYQERDEVVIDLHSANQFNPRDGFINSAMLYMEHFPYITRLWFGEYFDYSKGPNWWMSEVSGLPFGLMGEMLQDGGRPYRGMLYGMTARIYGKTDPRPIWRMMDSFGIVGSRMSGYWLPRPAVSTGNPNVLATAYVRGDRILVALASWSDQDAIVDLKVDPAATIGWGGIRAHAPAVAGLQPASEIDLSRLAVPANSGRFLILEPTRP